MTDYTKLIERLYNSHDAETLCADAALVIEALSVERDALQAENERLREMYAGLKKMIDDGSIHERTYSAGIELERRNAELQAKLDELQRQEPVATGCRWCKHPAFIVGSSQKCPQCGKVFVKEAPKALEPLTDEQSATLFQAVKDDPRSAKFSVQNWFTCGLVTAEAAHGITKGTP